MGVQPIDVSPGLAVVLNRAGDKNGVDFDYLVQTAMRESSLDPRARAATSSATGLFQFLDQTWLEVMKSDGGRLGYAHYANAIEQLPDGDLTIRDAKLRAEVLKLREEPQVAADLAAAFTRNNGAYLERQFGRMPSPGELYIAHFLGARGAEKLFNAGLENPDQIAAKLFPRQAKANRSIFFEGGEARTIREVYKALVAQHAVEAAMPHVAGNTQTPTGRPPAQPLPVSFEAMFSTGATRPQGSPLGEEPRAHAGFFAQLYGNE